MPGEARAPGEGSRLLLVSVADWQTGRKREGRGGVRV